MPTVVEHEDGNVVSSANTFPQAFESTDLMIVTALINSIIKINMKNEITTSNKRVQGKKSIREHYHVIMHALSELLHH